MKVSKRLLALLLALAIMMACTASGEGATDEASFTLPGAITVIDEEAFAGSVLFDRVILPEGVTRIEARAFANSSLSTINLPGSITYIAEDAFDGAPLTRVIAAQGSYGYDWAVGHGYLTDLSLDMHQSALTAAGLVPEEEDYLFQIGDTATWQAEAMGGAEPYRYAFSLYCNGELLAASTDEAASAFSHTFAAPGEYQLHIAVGLGL